MNILYTFIWLCNLNVFKYVNLYSSHVKKVRQCMDLFPRCSWPSISATPLFFVSFGCYYCMAPSPRYSYQSLIVPVCFLSSNSPLNLSGWNPPILGIYRLGHIRFWDYNRLAFYINITIIKVEMYIKNNILPV